jgi:hypothetical protein
VIIWLNGTFGVGKTSTAERLVSLVPGSRVVDPETVGYMLQANLADRPVPDFQDWAAWRALVPATLIEVARMTGQHLIAPQTVLRKEYLDALFAPLAAAQLKVVHVVLDASDSVLRSRIEMSDEAQEWRLGHLEDYRAAREWLTDSADLVVDTAASTPPQIARRIVAGLPPMLSVPGAVPGFPGAAPAAPPAPAAARPAAKTSSSASAVPAPAS